MQGVEAHQADFRGANLQMANFGWAYLEGALMPPPAKDRPPSPAEIAEESPASQPDRDNGQDRGRANGNGQATERQRGRR